MPDFNSILNWIEQHEKTVDLLKWIFLLILAWTVGLFRYLHNLTRKPKLHVSDLTSRCFVEEMEQYEGHPNAIRAALLIEVGVTNRGSEPIVVRTIEVRIRRLLPLRRWGAWIAATTLPNRVHHKMGLVTKQMRNWFSNFSDADDSLTIGGRIEPKDADSGYALFVGFTHGTWNPKIVEGFVQIRVRVHLTTGEKLKASARIPVTRESEFFESLVPGVLDHIRHPGAWNLSTLSR